LGGTGIKRVREGARARCRDGERANERGGKGGREQCITNSADKGLFSQIKLFRIDLAPLNPSVRVNVGEEGEQGALERGKRGRSPRVMTLSRTWR